MKIHVNSKYNSLRRFVQEIPQRLEAGEGIVMHDGRNLVRRFDLSEEGLQLVVKRYKPVNFVQQIAYTFFCKTKAEKAFLFAKLLREKGFETPEEVAYMEEKRGGLFRIGYFISLYCEYPSTYPLLNSIEAFDKQLATDVAAVIIRLHRSGVFHGDLNLGNLLYHQEADGHYSFSIIDTNRSRFYPKELDRKKCLYNLRRVTNRPDLFEYIIRQYARLRGWDEEETFDEAQKYLQRFIRKNKIKATWKKLLK